MTLDTQELRDKARGLAYISDGSPGADKLASLVRNYAPLLDEVDTVRHQAQRLSDALEVAAKHMEDMADSLDDSVTHEQVHEQLLIGMRAAREAATS
jgi:hypothetical protein